MKPCVNHGQEGYPDSCAVSAVAALTEKPFKDVANFMLAKAGKDTTAGGFSPECEAQALEHFGFHAESTHAGYMDYLLCLSGLWPITLAEAAQQIGTGKALLSVVLIPGNLDTLHAVAYENGLLSDVVISEEPVTIEEWLKRYHSHNRTGKVWGYPDVVGITRATPNPNPQEAV